MHFRTKLDTKNEWRWSLIADNGRIIADSGEGYKNRTDCIHAIRLVQGSRRATIRGDLINALARARPMNALSTIAGGGLLGTASTKSPLLELALLGKPGLLPGLKR